jgi:hypothetical protein
MESFTEFRNELKTLYPTVEFDEVNEDSNIHEIEAMYTGVLKLIQKDATFFDSDRILFGVNLSHLEIDDCFWKYLPACLLASFFQGDIKEKVGTILNTVKSVWTSTGQANDEVDRVLNDEKTEDYLQEMFEYVTNLRSAKIFGNILEEIDIPSLGISLDNPTELLQMVRDPENPVMQKAVGTVQRMLKQKLEGGQLTQQQLMSDIEGIKAKIQSLFGNVFNEMLGGRQNNAGSGVMMSNSPEARRQRMLMRLQRKQREKTQR